MKAPIIAVIEVGSRGIRFLVKALDATGKFQTVLSRGELGNLGEEIAKKGKFSISKGKLERISAVINGYLEQIREIQAPNQPITVYLIGTEALRRADNIEEFLEYNRRFELFTGWEQKKQIQFQILDSPSQLSLEKSEAYYAFAAVAENFYDRALCSLPGRPDPVNIIVLDYGGGSTEIAFGQLKDGNILSYQGGQCFPNLGAATLKARLSQEHLVPSLNELEHYVHTDIQTHVNEAFLKDIRTEIYALGTPITNLAWIGTKAAGQRYCSRRVHNEEITRGYIKTVLEDSKKQLGRTPLENLQEQFQSDDVIGMICGLIVYKQVLEVYKQHKLRVCGFGLRYGFAYEKLRELQKE